MGWSFPEAWAENCGMQIHRNQIKGIIIKDGKVKTKKCLYYIFVTKHISIGPIGPIRPTSVE